MQVKSWLLTFHISKYKLSQIQLQNKKFETGKLY